MPPKDGQSSGDWRVKQGFLRFYVLITGAAVMSVEFAAQRLLEPFFGNSEIVWATLIGVILLALSGGYWIGGRIADKWPTMTGVSLLTLGAGIYVAVLPSIANPLLNSVSGGLLNTPAGLVISALAGTVILFMPPVAALGAISPYAVRLVIINANSAGTKTGSLYFWSTFGSLIGTFVPTLYIIPTYGVRTAFWISATLLILLGAATLKKPVMLIACLIPLAVSQISSPLLKPVSGLITEVETPYQFAQVYRLNSTETALSVNDSAGIQSIYTPSRLTGLYYDAYLVLPYMFPSSQQVPTLLIGMAAGTIPTLYLRDVDPFRAKVPMTGVEIDPKLIQLGKKYFHLKPSAAKVINQDGRVYIRTTKSKFKLMIVDAYSQEIYIPFYLTTKQFFQECLDHLETNGILAMNVNATSAHASLLRAIERTLMTVFPHVYIAKAPGEYNQLLIGSRGRLNLPRTSQLPNFLRPVDTNLSHSWRTPHPGPGIVLSDNHAPVQQMTNQMILSKLTGKL
jgi:spermidine synthase